MQIIIAKMFVVYFMSCYTVTPLNYYYLSLFITSLSSSYIESAHENPDKMKYSNNING